jgi:hypothetical protein
MERDDDGYSDFMRPLELTWEKVALRIERLVGKRSDRHGREWVDFAEEMLGEVRSELEEEPALKHRMLLDAIAGAAYGLAKAEVEAKLLPHAVRGVRAERARAVATEAAAKRADPVREAARADIAENPKTTQNACARRVAAKLDKDQRAVDKLLSPMFEWRDLAGGRREKRPKAEHLPH